MAQALLTNLFAAMETPGNEENEYCAICTIHMYYHIATRTILISVYQSLYLLFGVVDNIGRRGVEWSSIVLVGVVSP